MGSKKQLLVFAHQGLAYLVPESVIKEAEYYDILGDALECTAEQWQKCKEFTDSIQEKYEPILIGYLITGDLG